MGKVARFAIYVLVLLVKACSASLNGLAKDFLRDAHKLIELSGRDCAGGPVIVKPGSPKALVSVDVSYAAKKVLVEQHPLDPRVSLAHFGNH